MTSHGFSKAAALALAAILALAPAAAQEPPAEGQVYQRLRADLDGDGAAETVALRAYAVTEGGWHGQLLVLTPDGKVLWEGPRPTSPDADLAFGSWDFGSATLEVAGDVDGDGRVEVVGALPQSDVRPTIFRVLRWDGRAFRRLFSRCLVEAPASSGRYPWSQPRELQGRLRWIGSFESTSRDGTCVARVWVSDGATAQVGTATVAPDGRGFHVVRWIEPPR